jgi:GDP-4-dehydro-6-deoxy-D-mannose reductase
MNALVTGGNGFVGRHLVSLLRERGDEVAVAGRSHDGGGLDVELDLGDDASLRAMLESVRPRVIYHLAAMTFVPQSMSDPLGNYETNVMGTARLFEAVRQVYRNEPGPRLLFASSAETYGPRPPGDYPLRETLAPAPATPYAAAKLAGEGIALASFHTYGIPAVITRAFNHIGPGQDPRFAIPAFARQLAEIARGGDPVLSVGNLTSKRDFLDVRDVVSAYAELAARGRSGEIYNVCSGRPVSMSEILRQLITIAHVAVEVREDPERMRPSDVPLSYGDDAKLRATIDWAPRYTLAQSLRDVYEEARSKVEVAI